MSCRIDGETPCWGGLSIPCKEREYPDVWDGVFKRMTRTLEESRKVCKEWEETANKLREKLEQMEKKTNKMTKAEAFEYLKGKKVYVNSHSAHIQATLFEAGYTWSSGSRNIGHEDMPFLMITNQGDFFATCNMRDFAETGYEEISAEDILSIEIEEELEFGYDKVVELAKPLMQYLNEVGCRDSIRVSQYGIVHEPMSTLIFDNGIGE